jgi:N-acetyl-gamma-glutamyl-phosphate reductase
LWIAHYPECNESVSAYNIGRHRHTPEIEQIIGRATGQDVSLIFTPHLIPMDRGILSTTYSKPKGNVTEQQLLECLREFYADEPFVRVVDHLPATKDTVDSNFCDITVRVVKGRVLTISCLDNLIKGASGAAVQNFNVVYGFPETTALL